MPEENKNPKDSSQWNIWNNIFSELSEKLDVWNKKDDQGKPSKDKWYYINLSWAFFWTINIILLFILVVGWLYIYIQNSETMYDKWYLNPFCMFMLWDLQSDKLTSGCSSIWALNAQYLSETDTLKKNIWESLDAIYPDFYWNVNFSTSPTMDFLAASAARKLKALDMLNDFDRLKNDFSLWDKQLVICNNMEIIHDGTLTTNCEVYGRGWQDVDLRDSRWIIWSTWQVNDLIWWTDITRARSFLNFIDKNPKYNFQLLNKQKTFESKPNYQIQWFTSSTTVSLELKYNDLNSSIN